MSYIPDTRNPIKINPFSKNDNTKANPYYEGLLNDLDKIAIHNYDFGVEDLLNALDNFDAIYELAEDYLLDEEESEDINYFTEEQEEFLKSDKVVRFIKVALLHWAELERNEYVVSMFDNYCENEDEKTHCDRFNTMQDDLLKLPSEEFKKKYPLNYYTE